MTNARTPMPIISPGPMYDRGSACAKHKKNNQKILGMSPSESSNQTQEFMFGIHFFFEGNHIFAKMQRENMTEKILLTEISG